MRRKCIYKYYPHESMNDTACFYCGALGQSKDHIPPVSYDLDFEFKRIMVRACLLCNSLLGNKFLLTLLERCDFLLIKYENRFKRLLGMPTWSDDEINGLKGSLKRKVVHALRKKKHVEEKLAFIKGNIKILQGY